MLFEENRKDNSPADFLNAFVGLFALGIVFIGSYSLYRAMNEPDRIAVSLLSQIDIEQVSKCIEYGGGDRSCREAAIAAATSR